MISTGTKLADRYEVGATLGAGGMGEVYSARDLRLGRQVAIKILPESLAANSEALARFEQEARVLATISHPNIVRIYDFGTDGPVTFAVTELLVGQTLRMLLSHHTLSSDRSLALATSIAEGLAAAHSKGVVHRDLKPENIFITETQETKILDFGLARIEKTPEPASLQSELTTGPIKTQPGIIVGTVHYMSPEQVCGNSPDARSDIFAFGATFFEMLSGERAFRGNTAVEVMAAILKEPAGGPNSSTRNMQTSAWLVAQRCLEKDPQKRYQTAEELIYALKSVTAAHPAIPGERRKKAIDSIAVLPFANDNADPDADYLSDGITESLINTLAHLPKLRVMARTTVFRYKGQSVDPQAVGTELGVRAVLTGRVAQRGDLLNIQAELVDAQDGSQLWGDHVRRKMDDIFAMQEDISRIISEQLRLKLSGKEKKGLAKRHTGSTDAYQLYLKGRHHWAKRTADGLTKAIDYFEQAVHSDPKYALAYAGLSDTYNLMSAYGMMAPRKSLPLARDAAIHALELDPKLAEAHEALAHVLMLYDWNWKEAEAGFKKAIALNPNYASAHQRYAILLAAVGRIHEAIPEIDKAHQIDPLSLIINVDVGLMPLFQQKPEQALEQFKRTLELDPNFAVAHYAMGLAYEQMNRLDEAVAAFEKGIELSGDQTVLSAKAHIYCVSGKTKEAEAILMQLKEIAKERYVSPYRFALIYAALGQRDQAFDWLEKAYEDRSVWLIHIHVRNDPRLILLHHEPRFTSLLAKMNLPPAFDQKVAPSKKRKG